MPDKTLIFLPPPSRFFLGNKCQRIEGVFAVISYARNCLVALSFSAAVLLLFPSHSLAQSNLNLVTTSDPDGYVSDLLRDIETDGMSSLRDAFEGMGLNNPQNQAAISVYESHKSPSQKRWTETIGVVASGNSLKQYYAYAFIGGNAWIYIRIDCCRSGEAEWLLSNVVFNSEYASINAPRFSFLE
jgi:hypothetical protein